MRDGMQAFENSSESAGQLRSAPTAPPSEFPSQQEVRRSTALTLITSCAPQTPIMSKCLHEEWIAWVTFFKGNRET